jgi:hypothetical protein
VHSTGKWDIPRTEEGLQTLLRYREEARSTGDQETEARALLELAFLVKWVRSDNDEPPFQRSNTLSLEALEIYRQLGNRKGQISALLSACSFQSPVGTSLMLAEAEKLAKELGEDSELVRVIAARARRTALSDPEEGKRLTAVALEMYTRLGDASGMAGCYFSMTISADGSKQKVAYALEAMRLYREVGHLDQAGKAVTLAVMYTHDPRDLIGLKTEVERALKDAQAAGNRSMERMGYGHLAKIAEAEGDVESAEKFLRWQGDLRDSDGLTPLERWENDVEMTRMLVAMGKRNGNSETVKAFQTELRRLKKEKPEPS